jgi:hypothetical protein
MATTQETIQANLIALGFDNPSVEALYNKIAEAIGQTVDVTATELHNSETRIFNIINTQRYGKNGYYTGKALAFQYGDNLIVDPITLDFVYATIDKSKQIISQAAFEEINSGNSSQLFLKIATLNKTIGLLEQLTIQQYNAFSNYFKNFEIPGLPVSIINNPGNVLFFNARATYYATYDLPTLQNNVISALNNFRNSFAFNGEFFDGDLEQYIKQNVQGIRDFYLFNSTVDGVPYNGSIKLVSGYFNYVANIQNNITYIPI